MAKQADVFPTTSVPFELSEREQKVIAAALPPRALPAAARKKVAKAIESHLAAVEALMAFMDAVDGDCDLEDGHDRERDAGDEGEGGCDDDLDTSDEEGIAEAFVEDQTQWTAGRAL